MLKVTEIYKSIQGESRLAGWPCVFVRLAGCNLHCGYCDTAYAQVAGKEMTVNDVLKKVKALKCSTVYITGGEPLLQEEVHALIEKLLAKKYQVMIGTNGTLDISLLDKRVIKLMDIKCPGSKMAEKTLWDNIKYLTDADEVKFVVNSRKDYLWAKKVIQKYRLTQKTQVVFSAVFEKVKTATLVKWILQDGLSVRFSLQLHKYIWDPMKKGV
jgi:7-carboxy-7-deazaguanine synthase